MEERIRLIEGLYRRHGPAILGYLRRLFGQAEGAEDLLQETFVQAMRSGGDSLARAGSPKAWLFGVARNVGMNARRRRRRLSPLPQDVAGPIEKTADDPRLGRMRQAIAALPEAQREALGLRLHDELSYEEIATVTGAPVGTVRSRLHHAVRRLREMLTAGEGNEERT